MPAPTKRQRSLAAKKGWRTRRQNPYEKRSGIGALGGEYQDLRHTGKLPNISMYGVQRAFGMVEPAYIKLSSGRIDTKADLNEFITALRRLGSKLP